MKVRRYKSLVTNRVDLVDKGANLDPKTGDGAHIVIAKRDATTDAPETKAEKVGLLAKIAAALGVVDHVAESIEKQALRCPSCDYTLSTSYSDRGQMLPNFCPECGHKIVLKQGESKQETTPMSGAAATPMTPEMMAEFFKSDAFTAAVAKAAETKANELIAPIKAENETLKAQQTELTKRAESAETIAKAEKDARDTDNAVVVAKSYKHLSVQPAADKDAGLFKRMAAVLTPEDNTRVHEILKAADAAIDLGKAHGSDKGADVPADSAQAEVMKRAEAMRTADPKLTQEQAVVEVLDKDRVLSKRYNDEQRTRFIK